MNTFLKRLQSGDVPLLVDGALGWLVSAVPGPQDVQLSEHPFMKRHRDAMRPQVALNGAIGIVPIEGPLAYRPDVEEMFLFGVEDSRSVVGMINEAATNPEVKGVLLRMDTPGGMMLGGPEIADAVKACRKAKPVVAHAGGMCASLGYMIASQANAVIANRSAIVGSIGVIASVTDYTALLEKLGIKIEVFTNKDAKFKAAGAVGTSLTDDQRTMIQKSVEAAFGVFKSTVLSSRAVKSEAMQGQTFRGDEGKAVGLVDAVGTEDYAISALKQMIPSYK